MLKSIELDLVNSETNKPYTTIVLAGENEAGKTTVLSTLNTFLCLQTFEPFDRLEYEVDGKIYWVYNRMDLETNASTILRSNIAVE